MSTWYEQAIFYHMYPLGMTGAPKTNIQTEVTDRFKELDQWIPHIHSLGCNAIYIGPLFESSSHGYDTKDYKLVDRRLGTNESFRKFTKLCHENGIKVVVDGVFNHTGREFFAFKDIQEKKWDSPYKDWYKGVNFGWQSPLGDPFGYEAWQGHFELPCLNLYNPQVKDYLFDVIRFWVNEFDIDGIRLDCANILDFNFMKEMRAKTASMKPDFWLMGEVIHGDYSRWVNGETLHSVTNYALHKALYSGHNDHNYFEIAHTVKYLQNMGNLDLYNFVDNHDVERIYTKLSNKAHFAPVHVLLYTLPGVPSIYYGSEFGIEGKKEKFSDDSLRPALDIKDYADAVQKNPCTALIAALGKIRQHTPALSYGSYVELQLTNRQFAFARDLDGIRVIVTVNNDDNAADMSLPAGNCAEYIGTLTGRKVPVQDGRINVTVAANSGEIWVPAGEMPEYIPVKTETADIEKVQEETEETTSTQTESPAQKTITATEETAAAKAEDIQPEKTADTSAISAENSFPENTEAAAEKEKTVIVDMNKSPEDMTVDELQQAILAKMAGNGLVTDQMKKTVYDNIWHDSLVNWLKSFH